MMIAWFLLLQIFTALLLCYLLFRRQLTYWSSRGIPGPTGLPFLGNMWQRLLYGQLNCELTWAAKYGKIYGTYRGNTPDLTILDDALIKQVLISDFRFFINRRAARSDHEIMSRNLFDIEDEDWKRIRSITSRSFTAAKLRAMAPLMAQSVVKLSQVLDQIVTQKEGVFKVRPAFTAFSIDIVASTMFATGYHEANKSLFWIHGQRFLTPTPLKMLLITFLPKWLKKALAFNVDSSAESLAFFIDISRRVLRERIGSGEKRADLLQLLIDASISEDELASAEYGDLTATSSEQESESIKSTTAPSQSKTKCLTENEILAQIILFFLTGYEFSSATLTHIIFELAHNQSIQERLCDELHSTLDELSEDSLAYYQTVMHQSPYLDAVIRETLRKYPSAARISRRVTVDGYKLGGIELFRNQVVEIPQYAVHHNAEYFPDPFRFNPERFLPENRHLLLPCTYLPFGQGPRNCIGMQFALQQIKLCLASILREYSFQTIAQTPKQMQFARIGLLNEKPFSVRVCRRM